MFIDVVLFPHELWLWRGVVLVGLLIIVILTTIIIKQHRRLNGLVVLDLNRKRRAKRALRNIQTTRL